MPETIPLLIDTDTGIDDAVAIALAARLPQLSVVAITTVHGNADVARATRNAREVARRSGLHVTVTAGAARPLIRTAHPARETHGEEGLGYVVPSSPAHPEPDEAAAAIAATAAEHPGVTLCCLGPLTNLAVAVRRFGDVVSSLGPVFVMGGSVAVRGTMTRWSEFNWWADPEAVDVVLRADLDIRLVPLDVTRRIAVPGAAIRSMHEAGETNEDARFWANALRFYAEFHRSYESFDGCVVNDPLAVALAADTSLADWREMRIGVSLSDDERRGAIVPDALSGTVVRVAMDVRASDVLRLINQHVFSRWLAAEVMADGAKSADRWLRENPQ